MAFKIPVFSFFDKKRVIAFLIVLYVLCHGYIYFFPSVVDQSPTQKIHVVFRYDDYSSQSPMCLETRLLHLLRKYQTPCTWGVIPFIARGDYHHAKGQDTLALTPAKLDLLRLGIRSGIMDVALHGYSHRSHNITEDGRHSEFEGIPCDQQKEKILGGKNYLEKNLEISINAFIPPWGTYDPNTINILEKAGFSAVSSMIWKGPRDKAGPGGDLTFIPTTVIEPDLRGAIKAARKLPDPTPVIVVVFHPFDFMEYDRARGVFTLESFGQTLEWLKNQKDIDAITVSQAPDKLPGFNGDHFHAYYDMRRLFYTLPVLGKVTYLRSISGVYLSPQGVANMRWRLISISVVIYGIIFIISFCLTHKFLFTAFKKNTKFLRYFHLWGTLVLALILFALFSFHRIEHRRLTLAIVCIAGYTAILMGQRLKNGRFF